MLQLKLSLFCFFAYICSLYRKLAHQRYVSSYEKCHFSLIPKQIYGSLFAMEIMISLESVSQNC